MTNLYIDNVELTISKKFRQSTSDQSNHVLESTGLIDSLTQRDLMGNSNKVHRTESSNEQGSQESPSLTRQSWLQGFLSSCTARVLRTSSQLELRKSPSQRPASSTAVSDSNLIKPKKTISASLGDQGEPSSSPDSSDIALEKSSPLWGRVNPNIKSSSVDQKSSVSYRGQVKGPSAVSLDNDPSPKRRRFVSSVFHAKWSDVLNKKASNSRVTGNRTQATPSSCFLAAQPTSLDRYRQTEIDVFCRRKNINTTGECKDDDDADTRQKVPLISNPPTLDAAVDRDSYFSVHVEQRDESLCRVADDFGLPDVNVWRERKISTHQTLGHCDQVPLAICSSQKQINGETNNTSVEIIGGVESLLPSLRPFHSNGPADSSSPNRASLRRSSAVDYSNHPSASNQESPGTSSKTVTKTPCSTDNAALVDLDSSSTTPPTDRSTNQIVDGRSRKNVVFRTSSPTSVEPSTGLVNSHSTDKPVDFRHSIDQKKQTTLLSAQGNKSSAVSSTKSLADWQQDKGKNPHSKHSEQRHFLSRTKRTVTGRSVSTNDSILKKLIGSSGGANSGTSSLAKSSLTEKEPTNSPSQDQQVNSSQRNITLAMSSNSQASGTYQSSSGNATQSTDGSTMVGSGAVKSSRDSIKVDFSSDSLDFSRYEEKVRRRVFAHYDCNSVCASATPLLNGASRLNDESLNAATGASRASALRQGVGVKTTAAATATSPMTSSMVNGGAGVAGAVASATTVSSTERPLTSATTSPPLDGGGGGGSQTSSSRQTLSEELAASTAKADEGDGKNNDMVRSCAYFRNEIGGEPLRMVSLSRSYSLKSQSATSSNSFGESLDEERQTWIRPSTAAEASILENLSNVYLGGRLCASRQEHLVFEYVDQGAFYYRHCFSGKAHQNYFGTDENLGPVAVSVIRDKIEKQDRKLNASQFLYRIIVRLCDLNTFRGAILEESLPSYQVTKEQQATSASQALPISSPITSVKMPVKELIELTVPELQLGCLRLAYPVPRTEEFLLKLDEQTIYNRYKVGILYCGSGQCTEEEMYNNKTGSGAFDEFLDMLGQRVRLKGFDKYKGGLDSKGDTTGNYSLYTSYQQCEIMFHVSTMLPYTSNNVQQLSRKRHIGNDIVTIIFQDVDALPFSAHTVRSHFQHVFVIVRVHNPNTDHVKYSLAISRCKDVPSFGPAIHSAATFPKSKEFRDFLLTKIINAENAVHKSDKFLTLAARTRKEFMRDLAENHVTSHCLESATGKIGKILGTKRRDRPKPKLIVDSTVRGCIVWDVQVLVMVEDFSLCKSVDCFLGISADYVVLIEREKKQDVLFCIQTHSIIGWTCHKNSLKIYYDHADVVILRTTEDDYASDMQDIAKRLQVVTKGCDTVELILRRNIPGQLGFHIQHEGIVSDVEMYGSAWQAGLRQGARLVEIAKLNVATLSLNRMLDLLITSTNIRVSVIPPAEDGSPRRGCEDPYCPSVLTEDFPSTLFPSEQPIFYKEPSRMIQHRKQRIAPTTVLTLDPGDSTDDLYAPNSLISKSLDELLQIRRRHSDECHRSSGDLGFKQAEKVSTCSADGRLTGSVSARVSAAESIDKVFNFEETGKKTRNSECTSLRSYKPIGKSRSKTISSSSSSETSELYRPSSCVNNVASNQAMSLKSLEINKRRRKDSGARRSSDDRQITTKRSNALCHNFSCTGTGLIRRPRALSPRHVSQSSGQLTVPGQKPSTSTQLAPPDTTDNRSKIPLDIVTGKDSDGRKLDYTSESERGVEWSSLVDAATRAIESIAQRSISVNCSEEGSFKLKYDAAQQRIVALEEKVDRLQLELTKERGDRLTLELQLLNERTVNKRLEDDSASVNSSLKKFAEWFVRAVDSRSLAPITDHPAEANTDA